MQRYFAIGRNNEYFNLQDDDIRHIKLVMRMKENDKIIVVENNIPFLCNIEDNYKIKIVEPLPLTEKDIPFVSIIVPILKEQKMDYILQKSTELGVEQIIVYYSERGIIKETDNNDKKIERWNRIMKEASEQCHRNNIPIIKIKKLNEIEKLDYNLICSTNNPKNNLKNILKNTSICDRINIVIGPEGGLTNKEENELILNGFIPITLGNRILRVETVPLFLMSAVNYEKME